MVDGDVSGDAAVDDSDATVELSAIAEALGGHLSPAENSLGEEVAALHDGRMRQESCIVGDGESSILQEGGGCGFGGRMDAMSCTFALRIYP
jgi:hypothetical protein